MEFSTLLSSCTDPGRCYHLLIDNTRSLGLRVSLCRAFDSCPYDPFGVVSVCAQADVQNSEAGLFFRLPNGFTDKPIS
jgi:hypothetical protein